METGFNKPHLTGRELEYMKEAVLDKHLSGNGKFTRRCQEWFSNTQGMGKCLMTTSCTDALEMAAILIGIQPGDEVILPSYTFVSTANAFVLRGAKLVFADSRKDHPGIDESILESLITERTKAIVPVHYAGVSCNMETIVAISNKYNLWVIEDAAQAIDSYFTFSDGTQKALGSIGHLSAFSFHETKNIISGEGGMLVINDNRFKERAEIIWEKGTNRSAFFRGEVNKYGWVDIGSSFLPSELIAAFLWAQLENIADIQSKRTHIWNTYFERLEFWANKQRIKLPVIPNYATNNAHMFYLVCVSLEQRNRLINFLKEREISAVFHYLSLHKSDYYIDKHDGRELTETDRYSDTLVRLPMFYELDPNLVIDHLLDFE